MASAVRMRGSNWRGLRRRGCAAPARLYSDGTIAIGTSNLIVHDALRYGTRNLVLAANSLNVGQRGGAGRR